MKLVCHRCIKVTTWASMGFPVLFQYSNYLNCFSLLSHRLLKHIVNFNRTEPVGPLVLSWENSRITVHDLMGIIVDSGTEEMPQWLRSPASLLEDPSLIPTTLKMAAHNHRLLQFSVLSSGLSRQQMCKWYTDIQAGKHP